MKAYVVGFAFDITNENVALILKTKPEWQAGLYNGIGGKIEEGERPIDAMSREFEEETGCHIETKCWHHRLTFNFLYGDVYFYVTCCPLDSLNTIADSGEKIVVVEKWRIKLPTLPTPYNLQWILPMMFDRLMWPISVFDAPIPGTVFNAPVPVKRRDSK